MPSKKAAAAGAGGASSIPAGKLQEMQRAVSQKDDAHTLRLLAAHPALLNAPLDASGRTALMHSAHNGRCNNVRALLRHGADVDAQTASGATAAWYAAAASKPTALRLLLRAGADPTAAVKEARGGWRSIFDVARDKGHADVLEVLATFMTSYTLRKARRLLDDYNILVAQDQAAAAATAAQQQQQHGEEDDDEDDDDDDGKEEEEEMVEEDVATQSPPKSDDDEDNEPLPAAPPMPRPGYLRLRPGDGAAGMPVVEVATAAALRAAVAAAEGAMADEAVRRARQQRKRRAGGLRAASQLEPARAALEFVLEGMGPELFREFVALMG